MRPEQVKTELLNGLQKAHKDLMASYEKLADELSRFEDASELSENGEELEVFLNAASIIKNNAARLRKFILSVENDIETLQTTNWDEVSWIPNDDFDLSQP